MNFHSGGADRQSAGLVLVTLPAGYPLALACYTLFLACVISGNQFGGLLKLRRASVFGEVSFSTYMLHGTLLNVAFVSGSDLLRRSRLQRG